MLKITLVAVGQLKENYLRDAFSEYKKRLSAFCSFNLIEIDPPHIPEKPSNADIAGVLEKEGKQILSKIPASAMVTALCIEGSEVSSEAFASQIKEEPVSGVSHIVYVIGGSYGLSEEVKCKASKKMSMSIMTFPHQLARIMLLEQIYRAFKIIQGGTYHK